MCSMSSAGESDAAEPGPEAPDGPDGPDGPGPLVSRTELAALLGSAEPPVLLDVRWRLGGPPGVESYQAGHLPGACFIDLDSELSGRPGSRGRHPLPETGVFETAMRRAGLHADQLAVAYDDGDSTVAARLWWMLRYYGHRRAAVLDGGYRAWATAGMPVTQAVTRPQPGDFAVTAAGGMPVLSAAEAGQLARSGFLLDARAGDRYRAEVEPVDRIGGHIPGAISAPTKENVGDDGHFLAPAELVRRFAALGLPGPADRVTGASEPKGRGTAWTDERSLRGRKEVPKSGPEASGASAADGAPVIGAYCGSGVTAAHEVLALRLAGLGAALYVGSWSEWSSDPARPVATGPEPG